MKLKESHNGFTEREIHSKALLNQDTNALLKYKIQKNRMSNVSSTMNELQNLKTEFDEVKSEISEIKNLLHKIIKDLEQ